jgi:hypothetical protein
MLNFKTILILFVLLFAISIGFARIVPSPDVAVSGDLGAEATIITFSSFSGTFNATGTVLDGAGNPVSGATVLVGALGGSGDPGSQWCAVAEPTANLTDVTDSAGQYLIENFDIATGADSCILALQVSKPGYKPYDQNKTLVFADFDNPSKTHTYVWDVTLLKYAELIVTISTDLINDPYANVDQTFTVTVNVSNDGDFAANSVLSNLSAVSSTIQSAASVNLNTIAARGWKTAAYTVKAPAFTTTDTLTANATGTDSDSGTPVAGSATKDIIVQLGAGGDDALLNVTDVSLNASTIEYGTSETIEVTATVLNDGNATSLGTTTAYTVHNGNDCTGTDVSSSFSVTGPIPASVDLAGNTQTDFIYMLSSATAGLGNYTFCVTASGTDANDGSAVGSNQNYATFSIVDTTPPIVTITSPAGGSVTGPSAFLNATTNEVASCTYRIDTGSYAAMASTGGLDHSQFLTGLSDGSHTAYVNCTDPSGNWAEASVYWFVDAQGPWITLNSPPNGSNITYGVWINLTIRDDMSAVDQAWYTINGGPETQITNVVGSLYYIDTSNWPQGQVSLIVYANDTWGNIGDSLSQFGNITFNVDTLGPTIVLVSPPNGSVFNSGTPINFSITDPSGVDQAWYSANSAANVTMSGATAPYYIIDTTGWLEGSYDIIVWANDTLGNENNSLAQFGNITIVIDDTPPVLTVHAPLNNTWHANSIWMNATATDNVGVNNVGFEMAGPAFITGALVFDGTYWVLNFDSSAVPEGTYNIVFSAYDFAGNFDSEVIDVIMIDHTGPDVSITQPVALFSVVGSDDINIIANVSDTGVGMIDGSICDVFQYNRSVGNITYNATTGECAGQVHVTARITGIFPLTVVAYDALGNAGNDSIDLNMTERGGGAGGGGGGGNPLLNETAEELIMSIDVEPNQVEMLSNETATLIITITNEGEFLIQSLRLGVTGLDGDEWSVEPPGIVNVEAGEQETMTVTVTPNSHNSGRFLVEFTVGNSRVDDSESAEFIITNVDELELAADARETCDTARLFIVNLAQQGFDTSDLEAQLAAAEDDFDAGNYRAALDACNSVLAFVPPGGLGTGITGLFIGVGDFVAGNWFWLAVAAAILLGLYVLGRKGGLGKLRGGKLSFNKPDLSRLTSLFKRPKLPTLPNLFPPKAEEPKTETKSGNGNGKKNGNSHSEDKKADRDYEIGY